MIPPKVKVATGYIPVAMRHECFRLVVDLAKLALELQL